MFGRKKKQVSLKQKKEPVSGDSCKSENVKNDKMDTDLGVIAEDWRSSTQVW